MIHIHIAKFMPGIAWFFIVLVLMCKPGNEFPPVGWLDKIYFDKWAHAGVFGLLALLFMIPVALSPLDNKDKLQYLIRIAIATSLWGLTTEFIQKFFISGRSFDLLDWVADSLGAFISFILCRKKYIF